MATTAPQSCPSVPFVEAIPGGLTIGQAIRIKGKMSNAGVRFAIYIQKSKSLWPKDNSSLQLSIRPKENTIIRYHYAKHNRPWDKENQGGCPIQRGENFDIFISAESTFFSIKINGLDFCRYDYRMPLIENSQYIAVEGDCTINFIGYETVDLQT